MYNIVYNGHFFNLGLNKVLQGFNHLRVVQNGDVKRRLCQSIVKYQ